jgi:hypothetical protein
MEAIVVLLMVVALMVFLCFDVSKLVGQFRQHFPTAKERPYKWSQRDPMGHW